MSDFDVEESSVSLYQEQTTECGECENRLKCLLITREIFVDECLPDCKLTKEQIWEGYRAQTKSLYLLFKNNKGIIRHGYFVCARTTKQPSNSHWRVMFSREYSLSTEKLPHIKTIRATAVKNLLDGFYEKPHLEVVSAGGCTCSGLSRLCLCCGPCTCPPCGICTCPPPQNITKMVGEHGRKIVEIIDVSKCLTKKEKYMFRKDAHYNQCSTPVKKVLFPTRWWSMYYDKALKLWKEEEERIDT